MDLEPDQPSDALAGVQFIDCHAIDNVGCGFSVALSRSSASTPPLNVTFRSCTVESPPNAPVPELCGADGCQLYISPGFAVSAAFQTTNTSQEPTGPGGQIDLVDSSVRHVSGAGIRLDNVASSKLKISAINTVLEGVATQLDASETPVACGSSAGDVRTAPVLFSWDPGYATGMLHTDLTVSNLTVVDALHRPWVAAAGCGGPHSLVKHPVTATIRGGTVTVRNPHGCRAGANVSLDLLPPLVCKSDDGARMDASLLGRTFSEAHPATAVPGRDKPGLVVLNHHGAAGCVTHVWATGGGGTSGDVRFSFYVDGESTPSVSYVMTLASASPSVATVGFADNAAPWGNKYFGHGSTAGGWYNNIRRVAPTNRSLPPFCTRRLLTPSVVPSGSRSAARSLQRLTRSRTKARASS